MRRRGAAPARPTSAAATSPSAGGGETMTPRELVRATELVGLPVLSITEGEALAEIKDVMYVPERGSLAGFMLNRRGAFAGPMKDPLSIDAVFAIGPDAVTVADRSALSAGSAPRPGTRDAAGRNVLANQVLTDSGARIGQVTDLVVAIGVVAGIEAAPVAAPAGRVWQPGDVVGYELAPEAKGGPPRFLPLPYTLAVSGEVLMVPVGVEPFIRDELSALGPAVHAFRSSLRPTSPADAAPAGSVESAVPPTVPAEPAPPTTPTESAPPGYRDNGQERGGPR